MALSTARYQVTRRGYVSDRDVTRVSVHQYRFGANVVSVPTERAFPPHWEHYVSSRKGPKLVKEAISRQQVAMMLRAYRAEGAAIIRSRVSWEVA